MVDALAEQGILAGVPVSRFHPEDDTLSGLLVLAATETTTEADIDALVDALKGVLR